jgi:hypothetical protein
MVHPSHASRLLYHFALRLLPAASNEQAISPCSERDYWIDEARLNHLRRQGVEYAEIQLHTGDMYVTPHHPHDSRIGSSHHILLFPFRHPCVLLYCMPVIQ